MQASLNGHVKATLFCWSWILNMKLNWEWSKYHRFSFCLKKGDSIPLGKRFCSGMCMTVSPVIQLPRWVIKEWLSRDLSAGKPDELGILIKNGEFRMQVFAINTFLNKTEGNITVSIETNSRRITQAKESGSLIWIL